MSNISSEYNYNQVPPKTWLLESILVTFCCCMPLGLVGIINAAKVETLYHGGRYEESVKASDEARKWTLISLIVGLVIHFGNFAFNSSSLIEGLSAFN